MVDLTRGCIAPRHPAALVAQLDEAPQPAVDEPTRGVHGDELVPTGRGPQATQPHPGRRGVVCVGAVEQTQDHLARRLRGHRPEARHLDLLAAGRGNAGLGDAGRGDAGQEGRLAHDERDLDRLWLPLGPTGEQLESRVGEPGTLATLIGCPLRIDPRVSGGNMAAPLGRPQGRVGADDLGDRTEHAQPGHAIGRGAHPDPA